MDANRMPGDAEAAAAAAGMSDTYGHSTPAIGDLVHWRFGREGSDGGRVTAVIAGVVPKLVVKSDNGGETYTIDSRMWPVGNRLDF